jgi:hypothetical protein
MSRSQGVELATGKGLDAALAGVEIVIDAASGSSPDAQQAMLAAPVPVQIVRATQFHEFVGQLVDWGRQGDVSSVPRIRTQLIAARAVAEVVVDVATGRRAHEPMVEVAGPRAESLVEVANVLAARRGDPERVEEVRDPADPNRELFETDGLLPGRDAIITGPPFEQWLRTQAPTATAA